MIWDTESQAFAEPQNVPKRYDAGSGALVDTDGRTYNTELQVWEKVWQKQPDRLTLVEKDVCATGIGTWTSPSGHLTCISPYVNAWNEKGYQPDLECNGLRINLSLYKTLYIDFNIGARGQPVGSGNIPFYFEDDNRNKLGIWQFNRKPGGTMTVDISSVTGIASYFHAVGSGTFYNESFSKDADVLRIYELWLE